MSEINLRPHQKQMVDAIREKFKTERFALAVAGVGAGKSYVAATIASDFKRVVVLQPSVELMRQNARSFRNLGIKCTLINATSKGGWTEDVIMSTANSVSRHLDKIPEPELLIIDELHLQHWGKMRKTIMKAWTRCKVFGMTATPHYYVQQVRYKGNTMYSVTTCCAIADGYFGEPVFKMSREQLKDIGYGADIELQRVPIVRARNDHFIDSAMYTNIITEHTIEVEALLSKLDNAIIYCDGVEHAKYLQKNIPGIECVFGTTLATERKKIVERFMKNETKFVATVGCLKLGFDKPDLTSIVILCNVNNPSNAEQQVGRLNRGTGKKVCYYNGILNTAEPVVGSEKWVEIKRF